MDTKVESDIIHTTSKGSKRYLKNLVLREGREKDAGREGNMVGVVPVIPEMQPSQSPLYRQPRTLEIWKMEQKMMDEKYEAMVRDRDSNKVLGSGRSMSSNNSKPSSPHLDERVLVEAKVTEPETAGEDRYPTVSSTHFPRNLSTKSNKEFLPPIHIVSEPPDASGLEDDEHFVLKKERNDAKENEILLPPAAVSVVNDEDSSTQQSGMESTKRGKHGRKLSSIDEREYPTNLEDLLGIGPWFPPDPSLPDSTSEKAAELSAQSTPCSATASAAQLTPSPSSHASLSDDEDDLYAPPPKVQVITSKKPESSSSDLEDRSNSSNSEPPRRPPPPIPSHPQKLQIKEPKPESVSDQGTTPETGRRSLSTVSTKRNSTTIRRSIEENITEGAPSYTANPKDNVNQLSTDQAGNTESPSQESTPRTSNGSETSSRKKRGIVRALKGHVASHLRLRNAFIRKPNPSSPDDRVSSVPLGGYYQPQRVLPTSDDSHLYGYYTPERTQAVVPSTTLAGPHRRSTAIYSSRKYG